MVWNGRLSLPMADLVDYFGNDSIRFYTTWIMPETKDSSFAWPDFLSVNNDLLIGNFGNFINRSLTLGYQTDLNLVAKAQISADVQKSISTAFSAARTFLEKCEFRNYLNTVLQLSEFGNKYIDKYEVYRTKKTAPEQFAVHLKQMYALVISLAYLTLPLLPRSSAAILSILGLDPAVTWPDPKTEAESLSQLISQAKNSVKPQPLFKKLTSEDIEAFKAALDAKLGSAL